MNKAELIEALSGRLGDRKSATAALDAVLAEIQNAVTKGDKVSITGFGVFEKRVRAARTARNPRTGESVKVKKTSVPAFRPGASFKELVAGGKVPKAAAAGEEGHRQDGRGQGHRHEGHHGQGDCGQGDRREGDRRQGHRRQEGDRATKATGAKATAGQEADGGHQDHRGEGHQGRHGTKAAATKAAPAKKTRRPRRPPPEAGAKSGRGEETTARPPRAKAPANGQRATGRSADHRDRGDRTDDGAASAVSAAVVRRLPRPS